MPILANSTLKYKRGPNIYEGKDMSRIVTRSL